MGTIYNLVHLARREQYDLDKDRGFGWGDLFAWAGVFTLAELYPSGPAALASAMRRNLGEWSFDEGAYCDEVAADIFDWAGDPASPLVFAFDCGEDPEEAPGWWQWPETGSRVNPDRAELAAQRAGR